LTGEEWSEAEIVRLQACFGARDFDHRVLLLRASLDKARQQHAKLWELRTATSLADLYLEQGDRKAAGEVLAPAYGWFAEGFGAPDLIAARTLLEQATEPESRESRTLSDT
jgi:predicted ATPase